MSEPAERRVVVITGASAGIGKAAALAFARLGWNVIGVGRDPGRCAAAQAEIMAAAQPGAQVTFLRGDFAVMADVKRVAAEIAATTTRIDTLVNNAGGVRNARYVSSEGIEETFAANHLAPFLLTRELLPILRATAAVSLSGAVRVLAVSSSGHAICPAMRFDDLEMAKHFAPMNAYCQAKLANLLFTRELDRRVAPDGIVAQAMHPGLVASNFASHGEDSLQQYMAAATNSVSPDQPARTLVWLATADEAGIGGGRYFHDRAEVAPAPQALDDAAAAQLWAQSEQMLARVGA